MSNPIIVTSLGEGGVNVDDEPYALEDNQLVRSQNATEIATLTRAGSLQTRTGFAKFNATPIAGPVLGGIEAPYEGTASAPTSGGGGGGDTGDPGGTGNPGDGSGTGPGDPVSVGGSPSSPAGAINPGGSKLFGGARLMLVGRADNTQGKSGWYLSSNQFADAAYKINYATTGDGGASVIGYGSPGLSDQFPATMIALGGSDGPSLGGGRANTIANGVLYYSEQLASAVGAHPTLPTIRKMSADGLTDQIIATVPENPIVVTYKTGGAIDNHVSLVLCMLTQWGNGDAIFFSVMDKVTSGSSAGSYGRVMMLSGLDSGSYVMTEVYNSLNTNSATPVNSASQTTVPYLLENYLGNLWIGFYRGSAIPLATWCMLRPDATQPDGWGCTKVNSDTTAKYGDVTAMCQFNGTLYVGFQNYDPSVTEAVIDSYAADGTVGVALTPNGGTALTLNYWSSLVVFNNAIYGAWYNGTQAVKIYKSTDGATWSAVFTAASGQRVPYSLKVDNGVLYAIGGAALSSPQIFLSSPDGTNWTDSSSNFTASAPHGNFANSSPAPILFGINQ